MIEIITSFLAKLVNSQKFIFHKFISVNEVFDMEIDRILKYLPIPFFNLDIKNAITINDNKVAIFKNIV
jgi:hypothetical protein